MTIEIHAEMPMCNLAETVHNKWLQQSGTKMTCLYEATLDNMIRFFMQIANYRTWLVKRSDGKKKKKKKIQCPRNSQQLACVEIQKCWLMP